MFGRRRRDLRERRERYVLVVVEVEDEEEEEEEGSLAKGNQIGCGQRDTCLGQPTAI